jgi:hypothetical protein
VPRDPSRTASGMPHAPNTFPKRFRKPLGNAPETFWKPFWRTRYAWKRSGNVARWCPRRGAPAGVAREIAFFVSQNEKRDLISTALGAQIPNPGSICSHAKCEVFDAWPRVGAVGGHFATVSLARAACLETLRKPRGNVLDTFCFCLLISALPARPKTSTKNSQQTARGGHALLRGAT